MAKTTDPRIKRIAKTTDPRIKRIAKNAFPDYKGRKFAYEVRETYQIDGTWSGGSKTDVVAVDLDTGMVAAPTLATETPLEFGGKAGTTFVVPEGVALVEHVRFCGKDLGLRVIVHPETGFGLGLLAARKVG